MLWSSIYETGNPDVDAEHKEIFSLVGKLGGASSADRKEKLEGAIDFLTNYVTRHFAHEERLMDESAYPKSAEHKGQHKAFAQEAVKFKQRILSEGDSLNLSLEVNKTIVEWLTAHIMNSDKALASHYKQWSKK